MLQAPQCASLEVVSRQRPAHTWLPGAQTQLPLSHSSPAPQLRAQVPQLAVSVFKFTQAPSQELCPAGHAATHAPLLHTWLLEQALPQAPQCCASAKRLTHELPQFDVPPGHWQLPSRQLAPKPHTLPQAPQFDGSS